MSNSDEEIREEMDTRNKDRIGWPFPLPAFPLYTSLPKEPYPEHDEHWPAIQRILNNYHLNVECVTVGDHMHHDSESFGNITLGIALDYRVPTFSPSWIDAVVELRRFLKSVGVHWTIELGRIDVIYDQEFFEEVTSAISDEETHLIEEWKNVEPAVMQVLAPETWSAMTVIKRSVDGEPLLPTAVVTTPHSDSYHVQVDLRRRLQDVSGIFVVEIRWSASRVIPDTDAIVGKPMVNVNADIDYDPVLYPGASIGVEGEESAGTMGGAIRLETREGEDLGWSGLTSQKHVRCAAFDKATGDANRPLFLTDTTVEEKNIKVVSPADCDHNMLVSELEKRITANLEPAELRWTSAKADSEEYIKAVHRYQNAVTQYTQELSKIQAVDRSIGHVYASSGERTIEIGDSTYFLDWSLIQFKDSRRMVNVISPHLTPDDYHFVKNHQSMNGYSNEVEGWAILYCGRSPKRTSGYRSSINTIINNERGICSVATMVSTSYLKPSKGDSGSVVITHRYPYFEKFDIPPGLEETLSKENGFWVNHLWSGLLHADDYCNSPLGLRGNIWYMIPRVALFADIERVTGAVVAEPWRALTEEEKS